MKTKTFKPEYIIDMTNANTVKELLAEIATSKTNANIPVTNEELEAVYSKGMDEAVVVVPIYVQKPKKNIFKRFWNWITRKNK